MLKDLYPRTAEGYGHWCHFINKEYYEKYVPKPKTVYELCIVKEVKNEMQEKHKSRKSFLGLEN